jgi:hypothetical protein
MWSPRPDEAHRCVLLLSQSDQRRLSLPELLAERVAEEPADLATESTVTGHGRL